MCDKRFLRIVFESKERYNDGMKVSQLKMQNKLVSTRTEWRKRMNNRNNKKRPFVIDCDTGTDDAIAVIAALGCEELAVRAITSVNGNVRERDTSRNNRNLMAHLGVEMEVAHGAVHPLYPRGSYYSDTHGHTGLGSVILREAEEYPYSKEHAPELIYRIAREEQGSLELLVIGPMTNIAIALTIYPELKELVKHIWFMGGAVRGGNVTTTAEFNIWVDPAAAKLVLASGIPMTMVGLDVTEQAAMKREDEKRLRESGKKGALVAADILDYMLKRCAGGGEDALIHDALALASAVYPECLEFQPYFVDVECNGEYTAGHTAVDVRGRLGKTPNVDVAVRVDSPKFREWLCKKIENCV